MASAKKSSKKRLFGIKRIMQLPKIAQLLVFSVLVGLMGLIALKLSSAFTIQEDVAIRFSLGTQGLETTDGNLWETVGYIADGSTAISSGVVSGADDPKLYQTHRKNLTYFKVPNLPEGRYKVKLLFADMESTSKAQRVFAIDAEGKEEQDELDIWRKTGGVKGKAYTYDFTVSVKDGELSLGFRPLSGSTILSAVEITPRKLSTSLSTTPEPTPTPTPSPPPAPTPSPTPAPTPPPAPPTVPLPGGGRQVNVSSSSQLSTAINSAKPGDVIILADGRYVGKKLVGKYTGSFSATVSGTAAQPIVMKGSKNAIIDGSGLGGNYGLYLVDVAYWYISGITVTNATKGIVLDRSNNVVLDNVLVTNVGQEGVHFRSNSSDNTIQNSEVSNTGKKNATYGEGVYIGSANSNWGTYNGGQPDRSDRNKVLNNTIKFTGAESIDIKEGSSGGIINGNSFDGSGMTGSWADSWIDIKGNNYTITNNSGQNALMDGFQIHVALSGWGQNTYLANNTLRVNGPGFGLSIQAGANGTVWKCSNVVSGAAKGNAILGGSQTVNCTP